MWYHCNGTYKSRWQLQAGNSLFHCPCWRQMLLRCALMTWSRFDCKCISRFYLKYRCTHSVAQFKGLYTYHWCTQNLFVSSHKFLDSHHSLNVSKGPMICRSYHFNAVYDHIYLYTIYTCCRSHTSFHYAAWTCLATGFSSLCCHRRSIHGYRCGTVLRHLLAWQLRPAEFYTSVVSQMARRGQHLTLS